MTTHRKGASRDGRGGRKPYRAPKLIVHGDIRTLTQGKPGTKGDGGSKPATRTNGGTA